MGRMAQWAAEAGTRWYGTRSARPTYYTEILAAGRAGQAEALLSLVQLAGATEQSIIVCATALELLCQYGPSGTTAMIAVLHDADALVRATAAGGLDRLPPQARVSAVAHSSVIRSGPCGLKRSGGSPQCHWIGLRPRLGARRL